MKRFISLLVGMAFVLGMTPAGDACTSIRIKTEDGLVFYARTMEGAIPFNSQVTVIQIGRASCRERV